MQEIARGVTWLPLALANVYLVGERGGPWVLIDAELPGQKARILRAAERRFGKGARPAAILLTHGHFDHAGSARALAEHWGVPIYAHRLELPYLMGASAYPPPDPTVGGFLAQMSRLFPARTAFLGDTVRELPADWLPGLTDWEAIPTPGHSPGHVSFFRRADRTLIAGDAFLTMNVDSAFDMLARTPKICRPPNCFTCDWALARRSVELLASLHPLTVATGHGVPLAGSGVAGDLQRLADRFPVPRHGRYVRSPAYTDERGVVSLPRPAPDPVPGIVAGVALAALAGVALTRAAARRHEG